MPQLDTLSWFDQVFSTLVVIFVFYFLLSSTYLPALNSISKARFKIQNYRRYAINFFNVQVKLLVQDTKNTLSVLFCNNVILIDSFFQLTAGDKLVQAINKTCYTSVEGNNAALQQLYINKNMVNVIKL